MTLVHGIRGSDILSLSEEAAITEVFFVPIASSNLVNLFIQKGEW
jgi:hypothetical protein